MHTKQKKTNRAKDTSVLIIGRTTMNFDYREGYWKAQVDLLHILENMEDSGLRSKKQYKNFITSLLKLVLTNNKLHDKMMMYGEFIDYWTDDDEYLIITKDGEVKLKQKEQK